MSRASFLLVVGLLLLTAVACAAPATPTPPPPTPAAAPTVPADTATPNVPAETTTPQVVPTLHPALLDATLPNLAKHTFTGGEIQTTAVLTASDVFTTSLVTYTSDGLKITGLLNVPHGAGKFPAVVLVHGYVTPDQYFRGLDAQAFAEELARHGYITLVPDLRGYMESGHGMNLFLSGFIADAVNAGNALKKLPNVDAAHVGLWGHSMGAGIATRAMLVSDVFNAVVLYAPLSPNMQDMFMDPFGGEPQGVTEDLIHSVITALDDPTFRAEVSPENFFALDKAPVSIHVGTADKVTPQEWARAIRDDLRNAHKKVEYFDYQGQGHSFQGQALQDFYTRAIAFFDQYLK